MKEININLNLQNNSRKVVAAYGPMFGKQLHTVRRVNIDNKYNEKKADFPDSGVLVPIVPITRYKIVHVDILSMEVARDVDGVLSIILNRGLKDSTGASIELVRPLKMPEFDVDPTIDNIKRAIDTATSVGEPVYFTNLPKLTDAVNQMNKTNLTRVNQFIEELKGQSNCLNDTIVKDSRYVSEYKKALGETDEVEATVHVTTTVEQYD